MAIRTQDALSVFTVLVQEKYSDFLPAPSFFTSMARETTTTAKQVGVEVRRMNELVAADVQRGSSGNLNDTSLSTTRQYVPPYFNEYFDLTSIDGYDRLFGESGFIDERQMGEIAALGAQEMAVQTEKIKRAIEIQHAQVLETGIVTMRNGDNVNYRRQATSLVNIGQGETTLFWDGTNAAILKNIEDGCAFIRQEGKHAGGTYVMIMGSAAFNAMKNDDKVLAVWDNRRLNNADVRMPQLREATGATFHGTISAGDYMIELWTYPQYYTNDQGANIRYWPENKVALVPPVSNITTKFAGLPLVNKPNQTFPQGFVSMVGEKFSMYDYVDPRYNTHNFHVRSAPLAVPVVVDQIYTMQVLA